MTATQADIEFEPLEALEDNQQQQYTIGNNDGDWKAMCTCCFI